MWLKPAGPATAIIKQNIHRQPVELHILYEYTDITTNYHIRTASRSGCFKQRKQSYLNAMHRRRTEQGMVDDFLKCRYLDRFERREGLWKIARRTVVYDWGVTQPSIMKAWWDDVPGNYKFGVRTIAIWCTGNVSRDKAMAA